MFTKFPKIARWNRDIIITEKLDGTNAQVHIEFSHAYDLDDDMPEPIAVVGEYGIWAGSRNRWITPAQDNFAFAGWVFNNRESIVDLGIGTHYGEWWGQKIQRGYDLKEKRFSLFNRHRWGDERPDCCHVVPELYNGPMDEKAIKSCVQFLRDNGSVAAPGFDRPEGIVIYHTQGNTLFKITLENDEIPKGLIK